MKNKKLVLSIIILLFGIPLLIHIFFKIETNFNFLHSEWTAGEMLGYVGTVFLGLITVNLSIKANDINNRLLHLENIQKYSYVELDNVDIFNSDSSIIIQLFFLNNSNVRITSLEIMESSKAIDKRSRKIKIINKQRKHEGDYFENPDGIMEYNLEFTCDNVNEYEDYLIIFKIKMTNIYGLVNYQCFNIHTSGTKYLGYQTIINEDDNF